MDPRRVDFIGNRRIGWLIGIIIGGILVVLALLLAPRLVAFYWLYWGNDFFKRLLYEDVGLSDAWASSLAVVLSFGYAITFAYVLGWGLWRIISLKASMRQVTVGFVCYIVVYALPHVIHGVAETWVNPGKIGRASCRERV